MGFPSLGRSSDPDMAHAAVCVIANSLMQPAPDDDPERAADDGAGAGKKSVFGEDNRVVIRQVDSPNDSEVDPSAARLKSEAAARAVVDAILAVDGATTLVLLCSDATPQVLIGHLFVV